MIEDINKKQLTTVHNEPLSENTCWDSFLTSVIIY